MIDAELSSILVARREANRLPGNVERLILRGATHRAAETDVPVADGTRDCDAPRIREAGSHVGDREGEEVASDASGCRDLVELHGGLSGREVQTARDDHEVRAEREIAAKLRVREAVRSEER